MAGAEPAAGFWYGFDCEHMKGFRALPDGRQMVFASELIIKDGAKDHDPMIARWADGSEHCLEDLTVGEYFKQMMDVEGGAVKGEKGGRRPLPVHFTGDKVVVKDRVDRHLLVSMYEGGSQILQARADTLGDTDAEKESFVAIMVGIAKDYEKGDIQRCNLKSVREERLKLLKKRMPKKQPKRKDAPPRGEQPG